MSTQLLAGKRGVIFEPSTTKASPGRSPRSAPSREQNLPLTNAPVALRFGSLNELGEN